MLVGGGSMSIAVPLISTGFTSAMYVLLRRRSRPARAGDLQPGNAVTGQSNPGLKRWTSSRATALALAILSSLGSIVLFVVGGVTQHRLHQHHTEPHSAWLRELRHANILIGDGFFLLLFALAMWFAFWWRTRRRGTVPRLSSNITALSATASQSLRRSPSPRVILVSKVIQGLVPFFILGMGIWGLVGGWHDRALTRPIQGGVTTTGRVVEVVTYQGKGTTYAAVVEFHTQQGTTQRFQGEFGSGRPTVGSSSTVSYDPAHPNDAHDLTDNPGSWKWPFFTGLFATVLGVLVGAGQLTVILRRRKGGPISRLA